MSESKEDKKSMLGTDEYTEKNRRRQQLIAKKHARDGLTKVEKKELEYLQLWVREQVMIEWKPYDSVKDWHEELARTLNRTKEELAEVRRLLDYAHRNK